MKYPKLNLSFREEVLFILSLLICLTSLVLWILCFTLPISLEFNIMMFSLALILWTFLAPKRLYKLPQWAGAIGILIFLGIISSALLDKNKYPLNGNFITSPREGSINAINRIIKEEDIVFLATRTLSLLLGLTPNESHGLLLPMEASYEEMRKQEGDYTSPLVASIIGLNNSNEHEALSFCGGECKKKEVALSSAVIFLHGVGGNWSLICWTQARTVNNLGMLAVCPSLGPLGMWGSDSGEKIVSRTIENIKSKGIKRIYLSGISAGAVGVAELAHKFQDQLDGVILLFGAHPDIDRTEIPTLLIYGANDERFTANIIEWVIKQREKKKPGLVYRKLDGGHFHIVKRPNEVTEIIETWLKERSS